MLQPLHSVPCLSIPVPPVSSATSNCALSSSYLDGPLGPESWGGKCGYACLCTSHYWELSSFYDACITFYLSNIKPLIVMLALALPHCFRVRHSPVICPSTLDLLAELRHQLQADLNMLKARQSRDLIGLRKVLGSQRYFSTTMPPSAASIAHSRLPRQSVCTKSRRVRRTHYRRGCRTRTWPHLRLQTTRKSLTRDGQIFRSPPGICASLLHVEQVAREASRHRSTTRRLTMTFPFVPCPEDKVSSLPMALFEQSFQPFLHADLTNV